MKNRILSLFEKHEWGKWEHVIFVQDFSAGIPNYEILRRVCKLTNLTQYRSVYVKDCVHGLTYQLTEWIKSKINNPH